MWTSRPHCPKTWSHNQPGKTDVNGCPQSLEEKLNNHHQTSNQQEEKFNETHKSNKEDDHQRSSKTRWWRNTRGQNAINKQGKWRTARIPSASGTSMAHGLGNDSNIVVNNNFITRYIVAFQGINKPYLTLPYLAWDLRFWLWVLGFWVLGFRFWVLLLGSPLRCGKSLVSLVSM